MGAAAAAGIGAVGAIGSAAMTSGSKGSSSGTQNSVSTPWAPQQGYITDAFNQAQNVYNQNQAIGPYTGQFVAGQNPTQTGAINQANGFTNGAGATLPGMTAGTAGTLQGGAGQFMGNASNIAANGLGGNFNGLEGVLNGYASGQTPGLSLNPQLSGALTSAGINGANSLSGFTQGQQNVMNQALQDPTQQLSRDAQSYMNSSPVQSAVNSTNALINQQLNEQTVPQLNRNAAMGGALNSSRAGMAESMANENAALATGNADSSILNNAFNTGLGTAAAERNAGLTTGMYAANAGLVDNSGLAQGQQNALMNQGEFNTNTQLGAANSGISGLNANTGAQLSGNSQLGQGVANGVNAANAAGQQAQGNYNLGNAAGALQQQGDQSALTNAYDQWQMQTQYPYQNLDNYWNIVGSKNWGGTNNVATNGSQVQTQQPGFGQIAGTGVGLAAGLQGLFGTDGYTGPSASALNAGSESPAALQSAFGLASNQYMP